MFWKMHKYIWAIALLSLICSPAMAQVAVDGEWAWIPDKPKVSSAPPMWEQIRQTTQEPMASLEVIELSAPDKLNVLREHNRSGSGPSQNGITHQLRNPAHISIGPDSSNLQSNEKTSKAAKSGAYGQTIQTTDGDLIWSTSVIVAESYRLRVRLEEISLPDGAQIWVQGANGEHVGPFGKELMDDGGLWTPSVAGPELTIVVLGPGQQPAVKLAVTEIAELFELDKSGQPLTSQTQASELSCLEDAVCVSDSTWDIVDGASKSTALLHYMKDGGSYSCSGGLMNDQVEDSNIPHFLTANHCISDQSSASSLEAYWDYRASYCGGAAPSISSLERTNGARLLVTGEDGDFTLLELNSIPGGRWLMGYNASGNAIAAGTILHRIAYPEGGPQSYSQTVVDDGYQSCPSRPRTSYVYQTGVMGATQVGSSGSPVMTGEGQIVGQLLGDCGNNIGDDCDYSNFQMDGAMNVYWSKIAPYIAPQDANPADLAITFFDAESGTYGLGEDLPVDNETENIGGDESASYRITFYASSNSTITNSDYNLGYVDRGSLQSGASHNYLTTVTLPSSGIPDGDYYIGAILTASDENSSNNVRYDTSPVTIRSTSGININPGLNGSWYNPATNGQGFFIDVLPESGIVFVSWFTYDTVRPPNNYTAKLGEPGHRWLTAQGNYSGSRANLNIILSEGGVFDKGSPSPSNSSYGTMTLDFKGCNEGTVTYSIPGIATNKVIPIQRVVPDNIWLCESLE